MRGMRRGGGERAEGMDAGEGEQERRRGGGVARGASEGQEG